LDNISTKGFYECIDKEEKTIIIITHNLESIIQCENIFFIKNSNEIIKGNHISLLNISKEYRDLYGRREVV